MFFNSRLQEPTGVAANEMGCDDEYGSNTSEALYTLRQHHEQDCCLGLECILRPTWYPFEVQLP